MFKKNVSFICVLFFTFISYVANAQSQGEPFVVGGATVHKVQSAIVANQIYEVRVALPGSYQSSPNREYPIIVVLDGQWNFTIVSDIAGKLAYDGMVPEAITVGITWGGEGDRPDLLRFRDFVRPDLPFLPMSGGANAFLSALTEELIPFVENNYRVGDQRVLLGASLGGLFTSYAMLEKPGYFDGYVAIAGSYFIDGAYLDEKLQLLSGSKILKDVRSYLTVGSLDSNQAQVETFNNSIKSANLKGFKNSYKVFNGVGHAGVEPIAYTYGLQYVFERPALKLSEAFLQQYAGDYEGGAEGQPPFPMTVTVAGKGKLLIADAYQSFECVTDSESSCYVKGVNLSAEFTAPRKFSLNSQGTLFHFTRVSQ